MIRRNEMSDEKSASAQRPRIKCALLRLKQTKMHLSARETRMQRIRAVYTCESHETAAFVRISRARLTGTPVVISTGGDDLNCAQYCKNNVEPTTGAQRACASYNYDGR